ncbi:MAG: O-acetylhomoserine aminocarboxypropyltransferase [Betaproteobacteria bacterium]|jgi:O-acetylhomoserine (thiol)-lyase|nr:O-acetylhomoserine aminocarboxypropyltransferase [Burkholderiales bacterium]NBX89706.1 O-acetylhomoserine aminocarboxypropyltransferase [Betaproteobacteria bacterium]
MSGYVDPGFDTLALHAGAAPDPTTGARAVPIYLTTSFVFESSDQAAALFNLERAGHVYSRISNPTNAVLEQRVAALEGGIGAITTASGQAALHLAVATLMGAGSHIVASSALYGGSHNLLHFTLRRFGIETTFVAPGDLAAWRAAVRPNTKLFFGETVGNPGMDVLDLPSVSQIAHEAGVPLLVDATLTSPWLMKPLEHGADLVVHSATKFLSGHGTVVGGVLVDGGSFDWAGPNTHGKFEELTQAYDGFHNMIFNEESSVGAFLLRARREGLRDFGACMSPHTAWLILQGIETLPLRMARHISNTEKVVQFLAQHPMVSRVGHPMLASHPSHALAQKLLPRGAGSVFSFDIQGTRLQGQKFIESLQLFSHLANVGDCRSLVIHPASTTHFRVDDETLKASGIGPGTVRLSIGLEDPEDLIDDLKKALRAAEKAAPLNTAPAPQKEGGAA